MHLWIGRHSTAGKRAIKFAIRRGRPKLVMTPAVRQAGIDNVASGDGPASSEQVVHPCDQT
jgi:hypothetical protein